MSLYREKPIKKTHKPHYCFGCSKTIPTGEKAFNIVCTTDDGFMHGYFCDSCHSVLHDCDTIKNNLPNGEVGEGDVKEYCDCCEEKDTCKIKEVTP